MSNVVVPLLMVTTGGVLVWAGITDPDGGVFSGLRSLLDGQQPTKRTADTSATAALSYDLAVAVGSDTTTDGGAGGIVGALATPAAASASAWLPAVPARAAKGKKAKKAGPAKLIGKQGNEKVFYGNPPGGVVGFGEKYLNPDYFNPDGSRKEKGAKAADSGGGKRAKVLSESRGWLGVPYVWGGSTRRGVDCSGLTQQVFKTVGVNLPHYSGAQATMGRKVSRAAAQPGDLVFFGAPVHHVGIYLGGGRLRHAPRRGKPVQDSAIWGGEPVFFRDVLGGKK